MMANQGLGFGANFKGLSAGFLNFAQEEEFSQMTGMVPQSPVFGPYVAEAEATNAYSTKSPAESLPLQQ
jgi:hypothetical protein